MYISLFQSLPMIEGPFLFLFYNMFYPTWWQQSSVQAGSSTIAKFTGERWEKLIIETNTFFYSNSFRFKYIISSLHVQMQLSYISFRRFSGD